MNIWILINGQAKLRLLACALEIKKMSTELTVNFQLSAGSLFSALELIVCFMFIVKPLVVQIQVPNPQSNSSRLPSGSMSSLMQSHSASLQPSNLRLLVVSAGRKTDIECRSWGSRPPAEITWWRGSRRLPTAASRSHYTNSQEAESVVSSPNDATNLTISTLSYTAAAEDDGQRLTCRADNLQLTNEELEDSVTISVRCKCPLYCLACLVR